MGVLTPYASFAEDEPLLGATEDDVQAAAAIIKTAVEGLSDLFPEGESADDIAKMFDAATAGIRTGMSVLSAVSGGVTFLRMIGVLKDPTKQALLNIQQQLSAITDKLAEMDAKIDRLTDEMAKYEAKNEYGKRIENAQTNRKAFKDFRTNYMENRLDQRIVEYDAMIVDAMKAWRRNTDADARTKNGVNNTRVTLLYSEDGKLVRTCANAIPQDFDGKILVLSEDFLPQSLDWNVNTYREQIVSFIDAKIGEAVAAGNYEAFETVGFPEFEEVGMSDGVTEQEAKTFVSTGCSTFKELDKAKNNALTGYDNYCYLTNSLLYYG